MFCRNGPRYRLEQKQGFVSLTETITTKGSQRVAYASFAKKRERLSVTGSHGVLGHVDPAPIRHLEKRVLIGKTNASATSEMNTLEERHHVSN